MIVLLDTELTTLVELELMSLGMLTSAKPANDFNAEVDLSNAQGVALVKRASDMVRECVLPQEAQ